MNIVKKLAPILTQGTMMANDYSVLYNSIRTKNPQADIIVEMVSQTIGNIIHTSTIQGIDLEDKNTREGILSSTIQSMVHTTTQHTLSQLAFGRNTMLIINQKANWQLII